MTSKRITELERQIAELQARWPAHSVPPAMVQQLEELEEELALERERQQAADRESKSDGMQGHLEEKIRWSR